MEVENNASTADSDGHAPANSIAQTARYCLDMFQACLALVASLASKEQALVQDQMIRFSLWLSSIGVFAVHRASMDYRLREAQGFRDLVQELLQGHRGTLRKCVSQLQIWSQWVESKESVSEDVESLSHDVQRLIRRCADDIGLLHRLSNAIRKAGRENQNSKASSSFEIEDADGNNFEGVLEGNFAHHLEDQLPGCEDKLRRRLAFTVVLRRRRILYRRSRFPGNSFSPLIVKAEPTIRVAPLQPRSTILAPVEQQSVRNTVFSKAETTMTVDVEMLKPPAAASDVSMTQTIPLKSEHNLIFPPPLRGTIRERFQKTKERLVHKTQDYLARLPKYGL
ncbi:hypothetical protein TruAng_006648 [Truncatella angustata]|nr:hypothetical protein TruAng_006648 [Truncatella angustata]